MFTNIERELHVSTPYEFLSIPNVISLSLNVISFLITISLSVTLKASKRQLSVMLLVIAF